MQGNEPVPGGGHHLSRSFTQMGLITSSVPRSLDNKNKLFGFELPDLLFIFMNLALTNLVFGSSSLRYPLVWGSTVFFALFLYFMKKDKPENYLQHFGEYIVQPTVHFAGRPDLKHRPFLRREGRENRRVRGNKRKPGRKDQGKSEDKNNGEHYERK